MFYFSRACYRFALVLTKAAARCYTALLLSVPTACYLPLVDLLLLVHTELSRTHVDQEEQTTDNRQDLEEIVLSKVLVGVIVVKLRKY